MLTIELVFSLFAFRRYNPHSSVHHFPLNLTIIVTMSEQSRRGSCPCNCQIQTGKIISIEIALTSLQTKEAKACPEGGDERACLHPVFATKRPQDSIICYASHQSSHMKIIDNEDCMMGWGDCVRSSKQNTKPEKRAKKRGLDSHPAKVDSLDHPKESST